MSTTAQKLEYLGTTKSQLKTMINYGLDDDNKITSSTTFRNYVLSIKEAFLEALRDSNTLFTNLPKKTGSGSNITLNGTAYAPMRLTLETNATTQASTPTPSSPQNVKVVTGLQQIKCLGKNLFDINATPYKVGGGTTYSVSNNVLNVSGNWYVAYQIDVEQNTNYFVSATRQIISGTSSGNISIYDATVTTGIKSGGTSNFTFNTGNNSKINIVFYAGMGSSGNANFSNIQLEKGSTATTYEPYIEQVNDINLGKNLLTTNYFINVATVTINDATNNDFTYYGCWGTDLINNSNLLKILKPSTTYTISFKFKVIERPDSFGQYNTPSICILYGGSQTISFQDARKNTAELDTWLDFSSTFTMPSSLSGYRFLLYNFKDTGNNTTGKIEIADLQIEEGSVATDFAPYFTPIELCKIDTYQDKIFKTSGKNLFDKSTITDNVILIEDGTLQGGASNYVVSDFIPIEPNTAYYKTATGTPRTKYYDNNKQPLNTTTYQDISIGSSAGTFTTSNNAYYLRVTIYKQTGVDSVMINKGTTATEYEPFGSNNEWYVKKAIGKVVLKGANTEDWTYAGTSTSGTYRLKNNDISALVKKPSANNVKIPMYSNYYVSKTADDTYLTTVGVSIATNGGIYIYDSNYTTSDVSLYKTWLSTHNTIVYYPLASPTYEKLNDTLQEELENTCYGMLSYKGQTNIMVESNILPFIVNAVAIEQ